MIPILPEEKIVSTWEGFYRRLDNTKIDIKNLPKTASDSDILLCFCNNLNDLSDVELLYLFCHFLASQVIEGTKKKEK